MRGIQVVEYSGPDYTNPGPYFSAAQLREDHRPFTHCVFTERNAHAMLRIVDAVLGARDAGAYGMLFGKAITEAVEDLLAWNGDLDGSS